MATRSLNKRGKKGCGVTVYPSCCDVWSHDGSIVEKRNKDPHMENKTTAAAIQRQRRKAKGEPEAKGVERVTVGIGAEQTLFPTTAQQNLDLFWGFRPKTSSRRS